MNLEYEKKRVLITVKTYPLPSETYQELVCTAGVLEDGTFIRLYPIDYRYRQDWQKYKKYQWIEVELARNPEDHRKESYRPKVESIRILSKKPLSTKNKWAERKKYVLPKIAQSMEKLKEMQAKDNTSLGIIKPARISDFVIEKSETDWKPAMKKVFQQQRLFGPDQKPLEKIPFNFYYKFECLDPSCKGHTKIMLDWEIGELFRKMRDKYRDDEKAAVMVRQRFFDQICGKDIDTHFFVGTNLQYGTWMVLGAFWPKK